MPAPLVENSSEGTDPRARRNFFTCLARSVGGYRTAIQLQLLVSPAGPDEGWYHRQVLLCRNPQPPSERRILLPQGGVKPKGET